MNEQALEIAKEWMNNTYFAEEDRAEIQALIDEKNHEEIVDRFYKGLDFGTGGLRGVLGMGSNRMNVYNIRKATQAVANEVLATKVDSPKVSVCYDSRNFSFEFAKEVASVFAANGIKAFIFNRLNPVGYLSFAVRHHGCTAGVMVTASHNPPEYNGYKVYWDDGAQVVAPYDQNIIGHYNSIKDFSTIKTADFDAAMSDGMIEWIGEETENAYINMLHTKVINPDLCKERGKELNIVYTPIHGTGTVPVMRILNEMGFTGTQIVESQKEPNGNFPTVTSPNPENPEAMALAVEQMKETKADIVFGTDPDTDRLGVALMQDGKEVYLNGNQIGTLMMHYVLSNLKALGKMPAKPYVVKTIVTTPLQNKIAESFGARCENTLTGFKWICGKMREIENNEPEYTYVFGTEESFGYLNHDQIRDKDGVGAVSLMAEMTLWYKTQGMNLVEALDKIYTEYGFSHETLLCLNYYGKEGAEKIVRIMDNFRKAAPTSICGIEVAEMEDYHLGKTTDLMTKEERKIELPQSNVLGFIFKDKGRFYLRPSGTEPKIKFYIMIQEDQGSLDEKRAKAQKITDEILAYIKAECEKA